MAKLTKRAKPKKAEPTAVTRVLDRFELRERQQEAVLDHLAQGRSLRASCALVGMPVPTFLLWCDNDADLAERYARARDTGFDAEADAINEYAATAREAVLGVEDPRLAGAMVNAMRLEIDARKWVLSKRAPSKYGDKLDVTSAGASIAPQVMIIAGREVTF